MLVALESKSLLAKLSLTAALGCLTTEVLMKVLAMLRVSAQLPSKLGLR